MKHIPLVNGGWTLVDDADWEIYSEKQWYRMRPHKIDYAASADRFRIYLHRCIMGRSNPLKVDHIDGDGLNNQRSNLRLCTNSQNSQNHGLRTNNTSGYSGVNWIGRLSKWHARIECNKRVIILGYFKTKEEAIKARQAAELEYFGEFSPIKCRLSDALC